MNTSGKDDKGGKGLGYTQVAFSLPLCVVVGWLIGAALDHWLGTHWIYLAGLGLGVLAGFYDIVRVTMAMSRDAESEERDAQSRSRRQAGENSSDNDRS